MLFIMLPTQDLRADLPGMHSKINTIPATSNTQTYCLSMKITPITLMCCEFSTLFLWILSHVVLQIDILKDPWSQRGCCSLWIPSIRFSVVPYAYFVCNMLLANLFYPSDGQPDSGPFESCDFDLFNIMLSVSSPLPQS